MSQSKLPHSLKINHSQHDQSQLHYTLAGSGSPALLFVHGWSCKRTYWNPQLDYFSNSHTVMAIDLPGHGDSPAGSENNITVYGANVLSAAEELPSPVVLVGHSMGGAVALEAARQMPEDQLAGVILVDTFLISYGRLTADEVETYYQPFADNFGDAMNGLIENCSVAETPTTLKTQLSSEMGSTDPAIVLPVWRSLLNWDPAPAFSTIKAPIHAINSPLITDTTRQRLSTYMQETVIPKTGHFLQMERPDEFNKILEQTLASWTN